MASDLNNKLEEALKSVVDGLGLAATVTVNTGADLDELALPYVVCAASGGGQQEIIGSGLFRIGCSVLVASSADDDTLADHRSLVDSVFGGLRTSTAEIDLSDAVSDFHVVYVEFTGSTAEEADRKLMNKLEMDVVCCGTDIS